MRLLVSLLLFLLIFYLLRSVLRGLLGTAQQSRLDASGRQRQSGVKLGKMEKDPVCGTYVDVATSVHAAFGGETKHFCSQECLNKYKKSQ
ncbi:MAG: hypothetical protein L0387_15125 [Acidobacteria bacterium]|nr:hypothetical protein [Acidobacteriota bacterium]MCI0622965.1 hypothetical protein [Acidobacteriota bacterium]